MNLPVIFLQRQLLRTEFWVFLRKYYTYPFIAKLSGTYEVLKESFKYQRNKACFRSFGFGLIKSSVCETGYRCKADTQIVLCFI